VGVAGLGQPRRQLSLFDDALVGSPHRGR
jgi:hypothetical protein